MSSASTVEAVVWPTTSKVVRWEPGRAVAWKTRESGATWVYEIEATPAATCGRCAAEVHGATFRAVTAAPQGREAAAAASARPWSGSRTLSRPDPGVSEPGDANRRVCCGEQNGSPRDYVRADV